MTDRNFVLRWAHLGLGRNPGIARSSRNSGVLTAPQLSGTDNNIVGQASCGDARAGYASAYGRRGTGDRGWWCHRVAALRGGGVLAVEG